MLFTTITRRRKWSSSKLEGCPAVYTRDIILYRCVVCSVGICSHRVPKLLKVILGGAYVNVHAPLPLEEQPLSAKRNRVFSPDVTCLLFRIVLVHRLPNPVNSPTSCSLNFRRIFIYIITYLTCHLDYRIFSSFFDIKMIVYYGF